MLETLKHLLGLCGEPHGFTHHVYIYVSFIVVNITLLAKYIVSWIEDKFWR
jgi:hypothetical protein